MTLLPSKHAGYNEDHRERDRQTLHTGNKPVAQEPKWDRDLDAEKRLRDYNAEWQVEQVQKER